MFQTEQLVRAGYPHMSEGTFRAGFKRFCLPWILYLYCSHLHATTEALSQTLDETVAIMKVKGFLQDTNRGVANRDRTSLSDQDTKTLERIELTQMEGSLKHAVVFVACFSKVNTSKSQSPPKQVMIASAGMKSSPRWLVKCLHAKTLPDSKIPTPARSARVFTFAEYRTTSETHRPFHV
jgi:hypothetical protein